MGFWDFLRPALRPVDVTADVVPVEGGDVSYAWFTPRVEYLGGAEWASRVARDIDTVRAMTPAQLWRGQPHLRTVVSFLARNVAQLGLHTFERDGEDRRRSRDNALALALADPGDGLTTYDLVYALVGDKALYDWAAWLPYIDGDGRPRIRRLPPAWVSVRKRSAFGIDSYDVAIGKSKIEVKASDLIVFGGYSPALPGGSSPTIDALKETLGEMVEASGYRAQVWQRGGRASAVLTRPVGAPKWSDKAAERFREDWYANYTGDGPRAGGTPILEDGMKLERVDFSAREQEWVEGVKLGFSTVASAYHVNPTMVGILDNANYSNVREFRRMLYGDTLGPMLAEIEAVINTFGTRLILREDAPRFFVEFNIAEKLQGSFEEQAAVMSTMVGAPIMTRDEGRARFNLPALGGEATNLVTPLNVLVGGQASPRDSGSQNRGKAVTVPYSGMFVPSEPARIVPKKSRAPQTYEDKVAEVVARFFKRQERVIRTVLGAKAAEDWWDVDRWDGELGDDLFRLAVMVSTSVAKSTLDSIGYSPDEFDEDRTLAWLEEVSRRSASSINDATRAKIVAALAGDEPPADLDAAFEAQGSRALEVAVSTVTLLSGFASVEAARQVAPERATKTWVVTSSNPRASHAAMDGETVPLSSDFSNGMAWPGDAVGGADELANCRCSLVIDVA